MQERIVASGELTGKAQYPTLDTAHSFQNVNIAMPEPTEPQQPKERRPQEPQSSKPKQPGERFGGRTHDSAIGRREMKASRESLPEAGEHLGGVEEISRIIESNPMYRDNPRLLFEDMAQVANEMSPKIEAGLTASGEITNLYPEGETRNFIPEADVNALTERIREMTDNQTLNVDPRIRDMINNLNTAFQLRGNVGMNSQELRRELDRVQRMRNTTNDRTFNEQQRFVASKILDEMHFIEEAQLEEERGRQREEAARVGEEREKQRDLQERQEEEEPSRFGFYLEESDLRSLDANPMGWLDERFDAIYGFSKAGQELDSPLLQSVQTNVSEASRYLQSRYERKRLRATTEEAVKYSKIKDALFQEFNERFTVRLNLIYARTAVEQGGMEQIIGAAARLKVFGMLGSLSYDNGRVGVMFGRLQGMLEQLRNAEGGKEHHLKPDSLAKLQEMAIDEQFELAIKGLGMYSQEFREILDKQPDSIEELQDKKVVTIKIPKEVQRQKAENQLRAEITRSVRTAYDVLVISQIVAKTATRGSVVKDSTRFFSDSGAAFTVFNLEEYVFNKWNYLNTEEKQFLDFIKLDMALNFTAINKIDISEFGDPPDRAKMLDLGGRLLKDLYAPPDFFSGGWRINGIRDQLVRVTQYKLENDAMIKKLLERKSAFPEGLTKKQADLQARLSSLLNKKFQEWQNLNQNNTDPLLPGETAIIRRQIARELFKTELTKAERNELLKILDVEEKRNIKAETVRLAGRIKKPDVADFGLFLQLQQGQGQVDDDDAEKRERDVYRRQVWEKIKKYKTEDILRIVRTRANTEVYGAEDARVLENIHNLFVNIDSTLGYNHWTELQRQNYLGHEPTEQEMGHYVSKPKGNLQAFNAFDKFLEKYGGVMQVIREDAMQNGLFQNGEVSSSSQVDFSNLTERHRQMVERALGKGSADKLMRMFSGMRDFSSDALINKLTNNQKYVDLYVRTVSVDDAFLGDLQNVSANSGLQSIAQYWSAESGVDALKRNIGDIQYAINVMNAHVKFVKNEDGEERLKASKEMRANLQEYNGDNGAVAFRFSYGTEILFSMQDYGINVLHLGSLPFRIPHSPKQRVNGIGAGSLTRGDIRKRLDHLRNDFVGTDEKDHHKAEQWYTQMEFLTETDDKARLRMQWLTFLFYAGLGIVVGIPLGTASAAFAVTAK